MPERVFAVVGLFADVERLLAAIAPLKARQLGRLEAYTPYPVHGLDRALGLRRSPLGGMVLLMGILGAASAMLFELWASGIDYPVITSGKVPLSWQAFVPVMFEITVLFASFTAGLGMLMLLNRLPALGHPLLSTRAMAAITRDRLALALESDAGTLDAAAAREALLGAGAEAIEVVPLPEAARPESPQRLLRAALAVVAACAVAGYATYWSMKLFPVLPPMVHMLQQPRLDPQAPSAFFRDGRGMRMPVEGTVARGYLPYTIQTDAEADGLVNPLPRTQDVLRQGQRVYANRCSVCHGASGDGVSTLTAAYGGKPANLVAGNVPAYTDGRIFHTITVGKGAMPAYAAEVPVDDRWAVIHYVRALQRSQNARDEDVP